MENCEVEKDIVYFIKERGTGQDIPDPPRFINFCRGDINDSSSEVSEEDGYSVAQFQRTINPAFRSSSPQPSTYESHHDPQSDLAAKMGHNDPPTPSSRETTVTPQRPMQPPPTQQPPPLDLRRGGHPPPNYDPNQHGEIGKVPHNAYPTDGMTMFCRTGPPSERSSGTNSGYRPSSRDSQSEVSNPTSMSSQEPSSARQSPTKPVNGVALPGIGSEKQVQKKRSAFFSNSPFRRKSRQDKDRNSGSAQPPSRGTWDSPKPSSPVKAPQPQIQSQPQPQPQLQQQPPAQPKPQSKPQPQPQQPIIVPNNVRSSGSEEPVDPRANFQLNVGNNVFDVESPDKSASKKGSPATAKSPEDELDPIARALADLKTTGKPASTRMSADRYHGIATPVPPAPAANYTSGSVATPPPAYNDPTMKRLDAPQPAFTSAQMQKTTKRYTGQTQSMLRSANNTNAGPSNPPSRQSQEAPRARSPTPRRSASPQPSPRVDTRMSQYSRGPSPAPSSHHSSSMKNRYSQSPTVSTPPQRPADVPYSPHEYSKPRASPSTMSRAASPQPQFRQQTRPSSAGGMELQLSASPVDMYGGSHDGYASPRREPSRPMSYYGDGGSQRSRSRSRAMAVADPGRQFSRDGRPILHFGKRASPSYFHILKLTDRVPQLEPCTVIPPRSPKNWASPRATSYRSFDFKMMAGGKPRSPPAAAALAWCPATICKSSKIYPSTMS